MKPNYERTARSLLAGAVCLAAAACAHGDGARQRSQDPVDHHVLWRSLQQSCVPAARQGRYPPAPCTEVDIDQGEARGYAVFKDRNGRYQYLVLPIRRIPGIESPELLAADARNYFDDAWAARRYVEAALHRPLAREQVILAVNSARGRSQHQLHIHVDCIRDDVRQVLQRLLPGLDERWRPLAEPLPPHGHAYMARWVAGDSLPLNPFASLAAALAADDHMGLHSLAVAGARSAAGAPGFILLSGRFDADRGDPASSEELQDRSCSVAGNASPG